MSSWRLLALILFSHGLLARRIQPVSSTGVQRWADNAGAYRACEIGIGRSGCRGLVASRPARYDQSVLRMPLDLAISVDEEGPFPWLTRLALRLAEEMHAGSSSQYSEYVSSLPESLFTLHKCSETELALFQNETLASAAKARARLLRGEWALIANLTDVPSGIFEDAWQLAASRCVGIKRLQKKLVMPVLDMANHEARAGGSYEFDADMNELCLRAGSALQPGDEVFLDYGDRPTDEFLLQYGFIPEHNPDDTVMLEMACGTRIMAGWSDVSSVTPDVQSACEALLDHFPTTLPEDMSELSNLPTEDMSTLAMALQYRVAKKRLLSALAGRPVTSQATSAFASPDFKFA